MHRLTKKDPRVTSREASRSCKAHQDLDPVLDPRALGLELARVLDGVWSGIPSRQPAFSLANTRERWFALPVKARALLVAGVGRPSVQLLCVHWTGTSGVVTSCRCAMPPGYA